VGAPPLGALLMELVPMYGVLAMDIITAAIAISCLFFVKIPQPAGRETPQSVTATMVWKDVLEGLKYVLSWRGLAAMLGFGIVINSLMNPAFMLESLLVKDYFKGGAWLLSAFNSTFGIGMIAGGLVATVWGGFKSRMRTAYLMMVCMGIFTIGVGITPADQPYVAVAAMLILGISNTIQNAMFTSVIQAKIPPGVQARVMTVFQSLMMITGPLVLLVAAKLVENFGIQLLFIISGVGALVGGAVGMVIRVFTEVERGDAPPLPESKILSEVEPPGVLDAPGSN
jgi:DHA3 family macrolide efflux protein-like MFS transporter